MKNRKQIAAQDECAPDSLEYFNVRMKLLCGLDVDEFKAKAERINDGDRIRWRFSNLELQYAADHPYYVLYRVIDEENADDSQPLSRDQEDATWGVLQHVV